MNIEHIDLKYFCLSAMHQRPEDAPLACRIVEEISSFEKHHSPLLTNAQVGQLKHLLKIVIEEHGSSKNRLSPNDSKVESVVREYIETAPRPKTQDDTIYTFYKDAGGWFIDLPEYLDKGGSKADLALVAGADTMLDIIAKKTNRVTIVMDTIPFKDAKVLELIQLRAPETGGGDYLLRSFEGKEINQQMWLCDVTKFVFGYMPDKIYIKRVINP